LFNQPTCRQLLYISLGAGEPGFLQPDAVPINQITASINVTEGSSSHNIGLQM